MTLEAALLAALSVLAGIVAYFFKILFAGAKECKEDRERLSTGLSEVREQVAVFRGCPSDPCPARAALERSHTFQHQYDETAATPKPKP